MNLAIFTENIFFEKDSLYHEYRDGSTLEHLLMEYTILIDYEKKISYEKKDHAILAWKITHI